MPSQLFLDREPRLLRVTAPCAGDRGTRTAPSAGDRGPLTAQAAVLDRGGPRKKQAASDWDVSQIGGPVVRQIDLHFRLGPGAVRLHPCSRLPDWVLCQVGQIGLSARLPDRGPGQIGAFSSPIPCGTAGALHQAGRQIELSARLPKTLVHSIFNHFPDCQIGLGFRSPDWIRLRSVPDCQIGPARLTPD